MTLGKLCAAAAAAGVVGAATADLVDVVGGQTNVLLDFELISSVTDLELTGISNGVIAPGNLGDGSVAFSIVSPEAINGATDFQYETGNFFGSFSGSIGHRGTLTFNDSITLGNFDIGYDAGLEAFTVSDTFFNGSGLGALFAVAIDEASPSLSTFDVTGDLLITANFATILIDLGLTSTDLTGADVGDAWIQGLNQSVPSPGAFVLAGIALLTSRVRRRRS